MPDRHDPPGEQLGTDVSRLHVGADQGGVAIGGDNYGIVSTGDNAVNSIIQVQVADGAAVFRPVAELEARDIPPLATFAEREPVGRRAVIEKVARELASGMTVQLYGPPGAGKKAIARAVIRRMGATAEVRGFELLPPGDQPHTLASLYERLTASLFGVVTYEPPETRLRAAVAAASLKALVVIADCDLPAKDLTRLLGTFPGCVFLLTSTHRALYRSGSAHQISPLPLEAATDLVMQEIGHDHGGLQGLQIAEAYRLAAGQTYRLLQYAAFIRTAQATRDSPDSLSLVPPQEQAQILAAGLSEPARSVMVALATFGVPLSADYFAPVTGLPPRPAAGPALADAGAELLAAALVTRTGDARNATYRLTPDAAAAVASLGWAPANARTAARGLLPLLTADRADLPPPDPALLLAVAGVLQQAGQSLQASHFIRASVPQVLKTGDVHSWLRLVPLGLQAARAAGHDADFEYFVLEDRARQLLRGDEIALAAALGALDARANGKKPPHQPPVRPTPRPRPGLLHRAQAGAWHTSRFAAQTLSRGQGIKIATATMLGATAITTAAVVAIHATSRQKTPTTSQTRAASPHHTESLSSTPVVILGSFTGREPTEIDFSADAGNIVQHIHWTSWTATGATGHGTTYTETCIPDCAASKKTPNPATILLSNPVNGRFTVLTEIRLGTSVKMSIYPTSAPGPFAS